MIARLTRYEIALVRRDRRALWSVLTLAVLLLLAFAAAAVEQARADAAKRRIAAAERARWLGQGEKDPHSAAHYSINAFKPSAPLASLDRGIEPFVGQSMWLEAHSQHDMLHRPLGEASVLERAGAFNPAALLAGFAPLIAFLLCYTVVAQDRERGSLRLALGATLGPGRIVASKTLAVWTILALSLVAPLALGGVIAVAIRGSLDADALLRLLLWTAGMAAYLAILVAIGVTVALRSGSARVALGLLFGLWIVLALGAPRAASMGVEAVSPLPSWQAVKQQVAEEAPVFWSAEVSAEREARLFETYGVSRAEDLPVDLRGSQLDLAERHSHEVIDRVQGGFYDRVEAQDRLYAAFGWASPTIAVATVSQALAGSDFAHHRHFIDAAEAYRRALVSRMNADVIRNPANHAGARHTNDATLWSQVPEFHAEPPALGAVWGGATPAALALLAWLAVAGGLLAATSRALRP